MSKTIISLVITFFLVMAPIVGQFVDQQTSLNTQESLNISSIENTGEVGNVNNSLSSEVKAVNTKANKVVLAKAEALTEDAEVPPTVAATAAPAEEAEQNAQDAQIKEQVSPQQTVKPLQSEESTSARKKSVSSVQAKENSKPSESKATSEPKSTTKPQETSQSNATKAGATPTPSAAPNQEATPKPVDPPKSPAQTDSNNQKSTPSNNEPVFDTSKVNSGTIGVRYNNTSGKRVKLMIEKGDSRYTYNLAGDGSLETFPLQSGNGEYTVSVMENTEGSKYRYIMTEKVNVKAKDSNSAYLNSIQMINWNSNMAAIKKAKDLTSGVSSHEAKLKKIYNYVVSNIRYDYDKLANLPSTYVPVIDNTYKSKSGICYDFASLTAAMLRSVGVPT